MPDQFTHFLVARESLKRLGDVPDRKAFFLGSQGADLLYYTEAFGSKLGTRIGFKIHREKTGSVPSFFAEFASQEKRHRDEILSYAAGIITHFWADAVFHPYIIYHTGVFILGKPETIVARYRHKRMESAMDYIFARRYGIVPPIGRFDPHIWYLKYRTLPKWLRNAWHYVASTHYGIKHDVRRISEIAYIGMHIYAAVFYPPTELRKAVVHLLDRLLPIVPWRTYLTVTEPETDFTNSNHDIWFHPCIPDEPRRESIYDLFEDVVGRSVRSIRSFFDDPLGFRLPNLSLEHGLERPCEYKVFRIIKI